MRIFEWLEASSFSLWVGQSVYGYPIVLSLHAVGLAIVVGTLLMLDLRLLGLLRGMSFDAFGGVLRLAWAGFLINLLSGLALFISQATTFATNRQFLVKIAAILLAAVITAALQYLLRRHAADWDAKSAASGPAKVLAAVSLLLWLVAIVAGRLIAYTDRLFVPAF